jgi:hypothetical protein
MSRARAERLLVLDGKEHPRGSNPVGLAKLQIEGDAGAHVSGIGRPAARNCTIDASAV